MKTINTLRDLSLALSAEALTAEEVAERIISKIRERNTLLRAYISVDAEGALGQAREADAEMRRRGPKSALHGAPIAVKDIMAVEGIPMTAGSRILGRKPAKRDSAPVAKARAAGAIILGSTNLHEFAAGTTNLNIHHGYTRNPWNTDYITGGSSGGSALAASAGLAAASLGTDTGGSVRIPAAICGVVGLKPSPGFIDKAGVFPLAWSLDEVGVLARSCWDAATLLMLLSREEAPAPPRIPPPAPSRPRIGVPWSLFEEHVERGVLRSFEDFLTSLRALGAEVIDVEIGWSRGAREVWRIIRGAEAAAVHRKWLSTVPHLYSDEVRENLAWGLGVSGVDYIAALKEREKMAAKARSLLAKLDALATPTLPLEAPRIREVESMSLEERAALRSRMISLTLQANVAGLPALSLPAAPGERGIPCGAQLIGPPGSDYLLLAIGWEYERALGGFRHPDPIYP